MDEMTEVIALLEELIRYCQAAECRCKREVTDSLGFFLNKDNLIFACN